jgi:imidazolonepropionase
MNSILIRDIDLLVQVDETGDRKVLRSAQMQELPCLENAWLLIQQGKIADFGTMDQFDESMMVTASRVLSAKGRMVFPSWCDSHTHLVYAKHRAEEFVDRIKGLSYEEIAEKGGGILNSAARTQQASETELLESAWLRLGQIKDMGTGAVEIKSGYGLTTESELKMLRVARKLGEISPMPVKTTFLGAHAFPMKYRSRKDEYIQLLTEEMIPKVSAENLADYIDVFCEEGFFSVDQARTVLECGIKHGMAAKVHANQMGLSGGVQLGVELNAISVDHLENIGKAEVECLDGSSTIATLLPSSAFFLNLPYADARALLEADVIVSLATDYNPGSTPSGKMAFVISLACIKMRMTPEEAINAATINAAAAMGLSDSCGRIAKGLMGNVFITRPMDSLAYIPYAFGEQIIEQSIILGEA